MDVRVKNDSKLAPDGLTAKPHFGSLVIGGGTAFASASNPNAEVIDGTGVSAGLSNGITLAAASGTLTVARAGKYMVELNLADFSCGAASGNVQFDVYYAPDGSTFAAFGTDEDADGGGGRMQVIRAAATGKGGATLAKVQHLAVGSKVRAIVTSAAGNAITVTEGALRLVQLADATVPTPT